MKELVLKVYHYLLSTDYYVLDPFNNEKVLVQQIDLDCENEPFYIRDSWIPFELFVKYYRKLNGDDLIK